MPIAVTCPRCQTHFGITEDLADESLCCPKCTNVFSRGMPAGIQAGLPAAAKTAPARHDRDDDDEPRPPSRPHATARAAFPVTPIMILLCGVLFLLLALSVGFNLWVIAHPDLRIDGVAAKREQDAQLMRVQAEQAAEQAARLQQQAQQQEAKMKRELDDLQRALQNVRQQLNDANRKLENQK